MVRSAARSSSGQRWRGTGSRAAAGSRPTSSARSTEQPIDCGAVGHRVVDGGHRRDRRVDEVAADLGARRRPGRPRLRTLGLRRPAASERATDSARAGPSIRALAGRGGDPDVVGDQHRPGSDRRAPRRRVGLRWAGVRLERVEGGAADVGERALRSVEEAGHVRVRSPAQWANRSLAPTTRDRSSVHRPRRRARSRGRKGNERHHVGRAEPGMDPDVVERRSMRATAAATTRRAASSTDSSGPPRVRTERWCSGSEWTSSTAGPAGLTHRVDDGLVPCPR